jgi:hypothetical protein
LTVGTDIVFLAENSAPCVWLSGLTAAPRILAFLMSIEANFLPVLTSFSARLAATAGKILAQGNGALTSDSTRPSVKYPTYLLIT